MDLIDGWLSCLSLHTDSSCVAAHIVVLIAGDGTLEIELACVLVLRRGRMVHSNNGTIAKADLIVSVTVGVVL